MINELTHKDGERVALNSFRYAWTVISNIFIYSMASFLLYFNSTDKTSETDITPADAYIFRTLTFIVGGSGLVCMLIFHLGLKESEQPAEETEHRMQLSLTASGKLKRMTWKKFLKEKQFYQCAFIWMCTRVILNVTQVDRIDSNFKKYFSILVLHRSFYLCILLIQYRKLIVCLSHLLLYHLLSVVY